MRRSSVTLSHIRSGPPRFSPVSLHQYFPQGVQVGVGGLLEHACDRARYPRGGKAVSAEIPLPGQARRGTGPWGGETLARVAPAVYQRVFPQPPVPLHADDLIIG